MSSSIRYLFVRIDTLKKLAGIQKYPLEQMKANEFIQQWHRLSSTDYS